MHWYIGKVKSKTESLSHLRNLSIEQCLLLVLKSFGFEELDFSETNPTPLHADNTSAIQITANPVYHERTKHIEVDCHSIREAFEARVITLPHISTDLQIADIFTKALPRHRHCLLSSKLMLVDQPASIWGGLSKDSFAVHTSFLILAHNCFLISSFIILYN